MHKATPTSACSVSQTAAYMQIIHAMLLPVQFYSSWASDAGPFQCSRPSLRPPIHPPVCITKCLAPPSLSHQGWCSRMYAMASTSSALSCPRCRSGMKYQSAASPSGVRAPLDSRRCQNTRCVGRSRRFWLYLGAVRRGPGTVPGAREGLVAQNEVPLFTPANEQT